MNLNVLVLPGDGIGTEVTAEAVRVLHRVAARFNHRVNLTEGLLGGVAIHRTGSPLPEQTLVLGLGAGRLAPSWDAQKGQFVPVTEADFTLSFVHRVLDGGAAGRLLSRIASLLSSPDML